MKEGSDSGSIPPEVSKITELLSSAVDCDTIERQLPVQSLRRGQDFLDLKSPFGGFQHTLATLAENAETIGTVAENAETIDNVAGKMADDARKLITATSSIFHLVALSLRVA